MLVPEVGIERFGNALLAWCKPIVDEDFLMANVTLDDSEKSKIKTMTANHRRCEWLTTRWLFHTVLPGDFKVTYHENGKPEINHGEKSISISHCKDLVSIFIGENGCSVGLDCESVTSRILKIKHKFASTIELSQIKAKELENLTLLWCAKEALFKLYAKGHIDFIEHLMVNDFDFSCEGGTFTGTILKEQTNHYIMHYKHIQNSLLVWVSE